MTYGEVQECVAAKDEYTAAHHAYINSYDAIHRYKAADDNLRRLLWEHRHGLIELANAMVQQET